MAFSANVIPQNKTLIPLRLQNTNPNFSKSLSITHTQSLQFLKRTSISASSTRVVSDFEVMEKSSNLIADSWETFSGNVSGEWDGHGADFTNEGKTIELPENVVPDAYREWEVRVFDWQTQCPTLAKPHEKILDYKLIKLLPTVGCEADAATRHSVDERSIGGSDNEVSAFAYHLSGCYVAVWPIKDNSAFRLFELEHCLVDPRNKESRVRIVQIVRVDASVFSLQNIKVFREQWYGPFRNGEQLGGCAIRDAAFASTDAVKLSDVVGVWSGSNVVATFQNPQTNILKELVDYEPQKSVRTDDGLVLLPKQLWCSLKESEDGDIFEEVGWLIEQGQAITLSCNFSKDGNLKKITMRHEKAIPGETLKTAIGL
ncbi:hypothetical protein GIB67_039125 [Kingdonia uniflora]|uniref:Uncharacterized protein n=1 Tax=Kingdonia uniflora TaxID=39325 RepID=A0A7J7MLV4_9MAGN|nr:hypothetical protein GIB67_039125 [Kingdonia uniflora]